MASLQSLNPEDPLGIYLCDVTFPTIPICSVFFFFSVEQRK